MCGGILSSLITRTWGISGPLFCFEFMAKHSKILCEFISVLWLQATRNIRHEFIKCSSKTRLQGMWLNPRHVSHNTFKKSEKKNEENNERHVTWEAMSWPFNSLKTWNHSKESKPYNSTSGVDTVSKSGVTCSFMRIKLNMGRLRLHWLEHSSKSMISNKVFRICT